MPPITDTELRILRQEYHCAFTAHQNCVQARKHAVMTGKLPSPELLQQEAVALGSSLTPARVNWLAGPNWLTRTVPTSHRVRMLEDR